jgi:hypothetical protein
MRRGSGLARAAPGCKPVGMLRGRMFGVANPRSARDRDRRTKASSRSLLDDMLAVPPVGSARLACRMPRGSSDPPARSGARPRSRPRPPATATPATGSPSSTTSGPQARPRRQAAARLPRSMAARGPRVADGRRHGAHTRPPRQSAGRSRASGRSRLRDRGAGISARRACDRRARARPRRRGRRRARALLGATPTALVGYDEPVAGAAAELSARLRRDVA